MAYASGMRHPAERGLPGRDWLPAAPTSAHVGTETHTHGDDEP